MKRSPAFALAFALVLAIVFVFASIGLVPEAHAQVSVPPNVQARYFKKVFAYNNTLPKTGIKVLVVFAEGSDEIKNDILEALKSVGLEAVPVKTSALNGRLDGQVVCAVSAKEVRPVREYCKANGVLSISAEPAAVKSGDISIGIENVDDKAKIIISADRLKTERQDAADLLRLR